jgi:hypothetical protein
MRLQNIIESIKPAVMAKVEAVIARHEEVISSDKANEHVMCPYKEGAEMLRLESVLGLIEPSGLCEAAKIMNDNRRHDALKRLGSLGLTGASLGLSSHFKG